MTIKNLHLSLQYTFDAVYEYCCDTQTLNITIGLSSHPEQESISGSIMVFIAGHISLQPHFSFFKKVFIRIDPPFDQDYLNLTYLLSHKISKNELIINSPCGIRNFNEKLSILQFKDIIPKTITSSDAEEIKKFIKKNKKVILKPIHGMAGNGIFLVSINDPNLNVIIESMTNNQSKIIMAQEYIPAIKKGDKRIILLNGKPLPYGLMRKPKKNEVRANLAKGGHGSLSKLSTNDHKIISTIKPFLIENKLAFVGIDVIGNFLTEINVTIPTGLVEIAHQSAIDIEKIVFNELS